MKSLRLLLAIALASYMTGAGQFVRAQDANASPYSITLGPVQYASVKGNVGKFEALNWMPSGYNGGISDITFVKDINKDLSVDLEGSAMPKNDTYDDELTIKDGDIAFLKLNYNAFRKYYDPTGGVWPYGTPTKSTLPAADQGAKPNSQALQMDISYFKLEAGIGEIDDPFLDVLYEHDAKDGAKSLEQWESAYLGTGTSSTGQKKIAPAWEAVHDTADKITLSEKKDIAGVTVKANQTAEIDYNNDYTYMQYLNDNTSSPNQLNTQQEYIDAKLFGAGVRMEKWMRNDNTFAAFGYHYNHTHDTDLTQNQEFNSVTGVLMGSGSGQTPWSWEHADEDEHVWTGNVNTNLTPDLALLLDGKYEHMGSDGDSYLLEDSTNYNAAPQSVDTQIMDNQQDNVGEHVALHYSGIAHTALYAESSLEQDRGKTYESYFSTHSPTSDFLIDRLDRTQNNSWTLGGKIVPDRFFTFTTQVKQSWENNQYDTLEAWNPANQIFLDQLRTNGVEESSTLTWRPYHWLSNSLKYQFDDTDYMPRQAAEGSAVAQYDFSENHMLTSQFTYDFSVRPIDPLILMLTYSHVENYVRIVGASSAGGYENTPTYIPDFNSGDNSFLFSASYTPTENLTWVNTACYTISNNYVDFNTGVPLGSDFKMLNFTTSIEWTFHKWLKIGPQYEYATYKDDPLSGTGNYSANIFSLNLKFNW